MPVDPPHDPSPAHVHDSRCTVCGRPPSVSREYKLGDRYLDLLLAAVCASMDLKTTRSSKRRTANLVVWAPDVATQERVWARVQELLPAYEAKLREVTAAYLREHCGVELRPPPR